MSWAGSKRGRIAYISLGTDMTGLTNEQAFAEIYYSVKAIKDVLGITVQCFRFPFGDVDDRLRYIVQSLKLRTISTCAS